MSVTRMVVVVVPELVLAMAQATPMVAVMMVRLMGGLHADGMLHAWWRAARLVACRAGDAPEGVKASWQTDCPAHQQHQHVHQ